MTAGKVVYMTRWDGVGWQVMGRIVVECQGVYDMQVAGLSICFNQGSLPPNRRHGLCRQRRQR
jgi:hypothetical protein